MRVSIRALIATLISLLLALGGIALIGGAANAKTTPGASSVSPVAKQLKKKPKRKKSAKKKAKKAKGGLISIRPRVDDDGFWQPHVNPRLDQVSPGTSSGTPNWVDQLTDEQKQCLSTKAAEVLAAAPLAQLNMFTVLNYLPQFEQAATECNIDLPTDGEMGQLQTNVFFWYLALPTEQKTCLSTEWQAVVDAGVQPTDNIWAMVQASLNTCGVTPPFGLG